MQPFLELVDDKSPNESIRAFNVHLENKTSYWHYHPEIELTYVYSGEGRRIVGDHIGNFKAGQLMITGEDLPHDFNTSECEKNCQILVIQFDKRIITSVQEFQPIAQLINKAKRGLLYQHVPSALQEIFLHFDELSPLDKLISLLNILARLVQDDEQLSCELLSSVDFTKNKLDKMSQERLNKVLRYIDENKSQSISLEEISQVTHMTVPAFCRWFKNSMKISFVNYLNKMRVEEACRMMLQTQNQIGFIAIECGFESYSNFNRAFKKIYGSTPREYRRMFTDSIELG